MLINQLNSQKNFAEFLEKEVGEEKQMKTRPDIFDHAIIKKLTLFP